LSLGQLAGGLTPNALGVGLSLSASKEVEPGARAMLLLAENLFRLDATVTGDTIRTNVRNLSSGKLEMAGGNASAPGTHLVIGDAGRYEPARVDVKFALGGGDDRVEVKVMIGVLRFAERGTVRLTAQAILRQAPVASP